MARKLHTIPQPNPARSYSEAIERLAAWQAQEPADVNPQAAMRWLVHGRRTEQAIVLLHGLTATPYQFYPLGEAFFQQGYNVFIPRFPYHALQDRLTETIASLKAEQLVEVLCRALDIAQGLGEKVGVAGLSMGGVVTSWAAQYRPDVDRAIIISPAFAVQIIPIGLTPAAVSCILAVPNFFKWWDPALKDTPVPPLNNYPWLSSHALAQVMRLGLLVQAEAKHKLPAASKVLMVTNHNDASVDNRAAETLVASWMQAGAGNVSPYSFEKSLELDHDLISADHPKQKVDVVHPVLVRLMNGARPV
jgi:alpha-beta hydrolase superfamily lysophospholipase